MADGVSPEEILTDGSLIAATELAAGLPLATAKNGVRFASFGDTKGDTKLQPGELERVVEAVPAVVVPALGNRVFYFVPLALAAGRAEHTAASVVAAKTMIARVFTPELADDAICHRNVDVPARDGVPAHEGIFISARLLRDQFALAFEFFINVAHGYAASAGIPDAFSQLAWAQAVADVRGETSQDAAEARAEALPKGKPAGDPASEPETLERARLDFLDSAFSDALAIYMLSLAVDFDYAELREREYPLLAPAALAARLRLMSTLFPPNDGYEFSIRYRRR